MRIVRNALFALPVIAALASPLAAQVNQIAAETANRNTPRLGLESPAALIVRDVTLGDALSRLAETSGVPVSFSPSQLPRGMKVSCACDGVTVSEAVSQLLNNTDFRFREIDGYVLVYRERPGNLKDTRDVLETKYASFKPMSRASATPRPEFANRVEADMNSVPGVVQATINGRVTSASTREGLAGVAVSLEGTRIGTLTGADGRYQLAAVPPGSYRLVARSLGYGQQAKAIVVSGEETITADFALDIIAIALDEVVVTGTIIETRVRELPSPISVITSRQIELQGITRSEDLLRLVPGVAVTIDDRDGYYSRLYVRGASTFDNATIKTYIDGVEVANPSYTLNQIDPSSIEKIEIVRGPQASTMYGSEAIAGVMQIFTKKGSAGLRRPQVNVKVSGGGLQSPYQDQITPVQSHNVSIMGGENNFSYNLGGGYESTGEWIEDKLIDELGWDVPNSSNNEKSVHGGLRYTTGTITAELSARVVDKTFGRPLNKILADKARSGEYNFPYFTKPAGTEMDMALQTYGLTLRYAATPRWQNNLTLGYDYTDWEQAQTVRRLLTPADTFLTFSRNDWSKVSLVYNTALRVTLAPSLETTFQAGYDQWDYQQNTTYTPDALRLSGGFLNRTASLSRGNIDNHGFFGQAQTGWRDKLFLTLGLRGDANTGLGDDVAYAWSPRVGVAHVTNLSDVTLKTRGSFGSAVKPPAPTMKLGQIFAHAVNLANPTLAPERQTGYDLGAELYFGTRFSVQATHYNQNAEDLIALERLNAFEERPQIFQHQNVGRINNRGWEFEGTANLARFIIAAHYSIMSSVIKELAASYTGDLEVGKSTFSTPENIGRISLTYALPRSSVSLGMNHTGPRRGYELIPYYTALFGIDPNREPFRGGFGKYAVDLPSIRKYELTAMHQVNEQFGIFLDVDNLFDNHDPEAGDLSLVRGRQMMLGLRWKN